MLKVKLVPMTLLVPVIDNSGDHDCKMDERVYYEIRGTVEKLNIIQAGNPVAENVRQGASQNAVHHGNQYAPVLVSEFAPNGQLHHHHSSPPVSQIDPPIDTTVRDSEMRSTAPEMSLDEFRERPERTKTPPRPRANSWRHNE